MATERFFKAFPPTPDEAWEKVLERELKGADYNEKLIWKSPEGFDVSPYYRNTGQAAEQPISNVPEWFAWAEVAFESEAQLTEAAEIAAAGGMHSLLVTCRAAELVTVQKVVSATAVHQLKVQLTDAAAPGANIRFDPVLVGPGAGSGEWYFADLTAYKDNGCKIAEELGLALAHLHEQLIARPIPQPKLSLKLATGPNFFFEIAKLRAIRILLDNLMAAYEISGFEVELIATETRWNKAALDEHNNLLRTTNAALAAVSGGCDAFIAVPFADTMEAFRISNNTNLLLWHEGQLGRISDPGAGSWYIESLTEKLAQLGWAFFKHIESKGGFENYRLELGQLLELRSEELKTAIDQGDLTLVGVNKYVSPQNTNA